MRPAPPSPRSLSYTAGPPPSHSASYSGDPCRAPEPRLFLDEEVLVHRGEGAGHPCCSASHDQRVMKKPLEPSTSHIGLCLCASPSECSQETKDSRSVPKRRLGRDGGGDCLRFSFNCFSNFPLAHQKATPYFKN